MRPVAPSPHRAILTWDPIAGQYRFPDPPPPLVTDDGILQAAPGGTCTRVPWTAPTYVE